MKYKSVEELANQIFKEKEEHRKKMAKLPIEEKIKIVVKLQEIAVGLHPELRSRGIPWQL